MLDASWWEINLGLSFEMEFGKGQLIFFEWFDKDQIYKDLNTLLSVQDTNDKILVTTIISMTANKQNILWVILIFVRMTQNLAIWYSIPFIFCSCLGIVLVLLKNWTISKLDSTATGHFLLELCTPHLYPKIISKRKIRCESYFKMA